MKKAQNLFIGVVSMAVVILVMAAVTASVSNTNTPLYVFRMEQQSTKMNFLPTPEHDFTYTSEDGYTINTISEGYCGAVPLVSFAWTCSYSTCLKTCRYSTVACDCDTVLTCPETLCTCGPPPCPLR